MPFLLYDSFGVNTILSVGLCLFHTKQTLRALHAAQSKLLYLLGVINESVTFATFLHRFSPNSGSAKDGLSGFGCAPHSWFRAPDDGCGSRSPLERPGRKARSSLKAADGWLWSSTPRPEWNDGCRGNDQYKRVASFISIFLHHVLLGQQLRKSIDRCLLAKVSGIILNTGRPTTARWGWGGL